MWGSGTWVSSSRSTRQRSEVSGFWGQTIRFPTSSGQMLTACLGRLRALRTGSLRVCEKDVDFLHSLGLGSSQTVQFTDYIQNLNFFALAGCEVVSFCNLPSANGKEPTNPQAEPKPDREAGAGEDVMSETDRISSQRNSCPRRD